MTLEDFVESSEILGKEELGGSSGTSVGTEELAESSQNSFESKSSWNLSFVWLIHRSLIEMVSVSSFFVSSKQGSGNFFKKQLWCPQSMSKNCMNQHMLEKTSSSVVYLNYAIYTIETQDLLLKIERQLLSTKRDILIQWIFYDPFWVTCESPCALAKVVRPHFVTLRKDYGHSFWPVEIFFWGVFKVCLIENV